MQKLRWGVTVLGLAAMLSLVAMTGVASHVPVAKANAIFGIIIQVKQTFGGDFDQRTVSLACRISTPQYAVLAKVYPLHLFYALTGGTHIVVAALDGGGFLTLSQVDAVVNPDGDHSLLCTHTPSDYQFTPDPDFNPAAQFGFGTA